MIYFRQVSRYWIASLISGAHLLYIAAATAPTETHIQQMMTAVTIPAMAPPERPPPEELPAINVSYYSVMRFVYQF